MSEWKKVGTIGVDAGMCWIGDPCQAAHFPDYRKFLDDLDAKPDPSAAEVAGGVCVSTGYGDGTYEVSVRKDNGRIAEVRAVFIDEKV